MNPLYWTLQAMTVYGGSFIQSLAAAARNADSENLAKIKAAWPEYWARYEAMGAILKQEDDAKPQ